MALVVKLFKYTTLSLLGCWATENFRSSFESVAGNDSLFSLGEQLAIHSITAIGLIIFRCLIIISFEFCVLGFLLPRRLEACSLQPEAFYQPLFCVSVPFDNPIWVCGISNSPFVSGRKVTLKSSLVLLSMACLAAVIPWRNRSQ